MVATPEELAKGREYWQQQLKAMKAEKQEVIARMVKVNYGAKPPDEAWEFCESQFDLALIAFQSWLIENFPPPGAAAEKPDRIK